MWKEVNMKKIIINGSKELTGIINISGAKNAAVALIPAAILSDEEVTLCNVPEISDIDALEEILHFLNVDVNISSNTLNTSSCSAKLISKSN